ncbi:hypothetical protein ABB37_06482 [Leptomonas pyrrhocoris]|uniref:Uncharacterized protein n=1 Tax=Leptomonas pyrrhocoris TaxID=157538 RepID=A0A0M9FY76_LEPPY|nr:hypothetical protein ABB37_06482 [Leptomonas pyrrhocoris]XP_015656798.1 hypothetical protein ABB37_06482 [Leptomonas pyrrhocoris]KPA78358.1 hypothetical protein ABB37_06482 [Leptomonas pyrrhocoris]KPA78359.1 hypothetical protein ABB37_06482 [Leptomonas pyrrhocoris]|eukprot:XP_015656797.1 hypothetical protein ABB37_06482 [Leptomonas pyrrhocoris]
MEPIRQTSSGERHNLVPNSGAAHDSRRTSLAVPLLDEESLKANSGASNVAAGGFTLVSQGDDNFKSGNNGGAGAEGMALSPNALSKTLDQNQIYSMLQQQQAVAMAAAQLEQAYSHTCYLLQQCSHNALLTVLMSLLNDYPTTLVQPIRVRVEQVLAQQMSPSASSRPSNSARKPGNNFVPNSSAAPWTPSNVHGSAAQTPTASGTPGGHRRGRGHKAKEEEQEMCSIHNNMRAVKHLQMNPATGLYECIHGFHCLVEGQADVSPRRATTATTPSAANGGSRGSNPLTSAESQPFVPAGVQQPRPPSQPQQQPPQQPQVKAETRFSPTEVEALRMLGYSLGTNGNSTSKGGSADVQAQGQRRDTAVGQRDSEPGAAAPLMTGAAAPLMTGAAAPLMTGAAALGGGYTVVGDHRGSSANSPSDARLNMDIPSLEYLLQSVRDIDDE